ncbi:MAG: copper oxidase [Bryobacterales bacterium]|nr:copper oxidase [Bryobacterales bacterium]
MSNRRSFFAGVAAAGAGLFAARKINAQTAANNVLIETPDLPKLPWRMVDGVKEFHLIAEVVHSELVRGRALDGWGFNGSIPGPTLEINEGDRIRVIFENRLPEMTALHWHGLEAPVEMEGSVGLGQDPTPPGGTYTYDFTVNQHGTLFYHSHFSMQEMMGMLGFLIVHPKTPYSPRVHRDFGLLIQEFSILPNNTVPNTMSMEFNWLTFNGKSGPAATPMLVKQGERVRIRLVNLGMDHHPIHMHGNQFSITGTEGGRIPEAQWHPQNTVLVGVGQARNIEFDAKYLGDWMMHCHMPHHMMNQMVSMAGPMAPSAHAKMMSSSTIGLYPVDDAAKKAIPGYPQDMWMPMDEMFAKPETYGLRKGWSGAMMGMMTMVRVLPPDLYDEIQRRIQAAKGGRA